MSEQTTKAIMELIGLCDEAEYERDDYKELLEKILDMSFHWSGQDEEDSPPLKTIRTLVGQVLTKHREIPNE